MGTFILRRAVQAVLVVFGATLLIFLATFSLGDPFATTGTRVVPPEVQEINRAKFGMDEPLPRQYLTYLGNIFTLDLGVDFDQRRPVVDMLAETAPNTIRLALVTILLDILIGFTAGIAAAVKRYSFWDVLVTVICTLAIGVPTFVIGIVLAANVSGMGPFPAVPRSFTVEVPWYSEVLLPAFTLAIVDAAFIARLMRGSMIEVLRSDYIRAARAKGLTELKVISKHAVRNSMLPVVTYTGVSLGVLFGGAIIIETIFQYNGVGYLLSRAILTNNTPVLIPIVVFSVLACVVLSTVVDVVYAYLDPRIRLS